MFDDNGDFTAAQRKKMALRISQAIRMSKLKQADVARQMGLSRAAVSYYCSSAKIDLARLARFCQVTKASMDYLIFGETQDVDSKVISELEQVLRKARQRVPA